MVRVIMGIKGTGKPKQKIELINSAVHSENGNVVCIERGPKLTYDIHYKIRLVEASHYDMSNFDFLKGFISGLHAGNFDITHVFIESLYKLIGEDRATGEAFVAWCEEFGAANDMRFTITISDEPAQASEAMKKYL